MAQIPIFEGQTDVRSVGGTSPYASPEAFGSQIGQALQGLGRTMSSLSLEFKQEKDKQDKLLRAERVAQEVANGSITLSKINAEGQSSAPADGKGVMDGVYKKQQEAIEAQAALIDDPEARAQFRIKMLGDLSGYAQNNVGFELKRSVDYATERSNFALNGLENAVRGNAAMYDKHLAEGLAIIDGQQVPDGQKVVMKREWAERTAMARFQGMLASVKSPEDFDAITKELQDPKWQNVFKPSEYTATLQDIQQSKKVFTTQASVAARAQLDSIEARLKDGYAVDPGELSNAVSQAEQTSDPIILKRAFRAERTAGILERSKKLTATQLDQRADQITGEGYPNYSPRLADAAEQAHAKFPGVSTGFLGAMTNMEYGVYLVGKRPQGKPGFAPIAAGKKVDLGSMRPRTRDALNVAGEIYGKPLPIVSAYRSQAYQDQIRFGRGDPNRPSVAEHSHHTSGTAVDISTAGMSGADKGKLVDALIQAGFTGFGEYGTHIHADMRAKTPNSFNARTGFLGWSKGSPEVVQAMVARGYGAGADANSLKRGGAGMQLDAVDYGLGPSNGSTSAIGVHQWTDSSFLHIMRDPTIAKRIGLPDGLTDAQLLDLRKYPTWSFMATAAYAEQNKTYLEKSLGREVNDTELYMAHFLGPGGAQILLSAHTNTPDAIAADLMPDAAKNNPGRFYKDGKPLSVKEVYDGIAVAFSTAPTAVQYEDAQVYKQLAKTAREQEKNDPMKRYNDSVVEINDLETDGGFGSRGAVASAASDYFSIPQSEMKPFTADEAAQFNKVLADGSIDQKLQMLSNINEMDRSAPGMGKAALMQLNQKDTAYGYAGAVMNERNDLPTAEMIVRGVDRLKNDKAFSEAMFSGKDAYTAFVEATGGSLSSVDPAQRAAAFEAAKAYYAERAAQKGSTEFDPKDFKNVVQTVVGGGPEQIGDVNGTPTMLPPGITADTFNTAIDSLSDADLIQMGRDKKPPIDIAGDPVDAQDVAREGTFVFIGGTSYKIRMLDGNFLVTGDRDRMGRIAAYVFEADPAQINALAQRGPEQPEGPPSPIKPMPSNQTPPMQPPAALQQLLGN